MNPWRFLPYRKLSAFENMAIDEAIFRENQLKDTPPTLRFYGWNIPSVSIGYFQDASKEVDLKACRKFGYDVVRRPTGGKAVFHYNDLTYAVISKTQNPLFTDDIIGTYRVISHCIAAGLAKLNIRAQMAEKKRGAMINSLEAFCFSVPSLHELLVNGKKICGSAQVRSRGAFLQHGSLMISFDPVKTQEVLLPHLDKDTQISELLQSVTSMIDHYRGELDIPEVCRALRDGIEDTLKIRLIDGCLTDEEEALKELLLRKYYNNEWNTDGRHSKTPTVNRLQM